MNKLALVLAMACFFSATASEFKHRTNGLFLFKRSSDQNADDTFSIQSLSYAAKSNIDDTFMAYATVEFNTEYNDFTDEREVKTNITEAFVKTRDLEYSEFMFGKFYQGFSFLNKLRPEYRPFIFQTTIQELNFGEKGLNQEGVSFEYKLPTPGYSYLQVQIFNPQNPVAFKDAKKDSLGYLLAFGANAKLDENESLRSVFSATVADKENASGGTMYLGGELMYIKANPLAYMKSNGYMLLFNYIYTARQLVDSGYYNSASLIYKMNIKNHIYALGYENLGFANNDDLETHVGSIQYAYRFSKKVKLRFQYKGQKEKYKDVLSQVGVQMNFSFGDEFDYISY
jgi:hypothetical protein